MLPPGAPALNRDNALELLAELRAALLAVEAAWRADSRGLSKSTASKPQFRCAGPRRGCA
jgi:hypothetical protein